MTTAYRISSPSQMESTLGKNQSQNNAGGYVFTVDDWTRLDRFLVLGSEGGTYYVGEHKLTRDNAQAVIRCAKLDGKRVVRRIVEISEQGRAPKNEPAIFALALVAAFGDPDTKREAYLAVPKVCRFGTAIMHFAMYSQDLRGWGRGIRNAVSRWFNDRDAGDVAYQAIKYQSRDGWALSDLLRLSHPIPATEEHRLIYSWIVDGWANVGEEPHPYKGLLPIWAFERAKIAQTEEEIIKLITDYNLPFEAVGTQWRKSAAVWEALLPHMGMTALIRNLPTMTRVGLIDANSDAEKLVTSKITNPDFLKKSRIHPFQVLMALKTYSSGHSFRGDSSWTPVRQIVDGLDSAFYLSFRNVVPTNKRILLALDVSGSMDDTIGDSNISCREGSAAMALITAKVESNYEIVGFTNASGQGWGRSSLNRNVDSYKNSLSVLNISPRQRLDDAVKAINNLPFAGTDCALPMLWAQANHKAFDAMVVYTDSETWAGSVHPFKALQDYRAATGLKTKLVVVGMTSTEFSIADPSDAGSLDVVGFDGAAPNLISDFIRE